jgi:hypothetical protein
LAVAYDASTERLLHDIHHHPDDGVDARYKRLRVSADQGHRLKHQLLHLGLITEEAVKVGRTRKHLLRPTQQGAKTLGLDTTHRRESIAHEYWKTPLRPPLPATRVHRPTRGPRPAGGQVDVLATKASESVAIEIETGKSDAPENVRRDLLSGYAKVLVVATTERAWLTVSRDLERAGLHIPQVAVHVAASRTRQRLSVARRESPGQGHSCRPETRSFRQRSL